MRHKASILAVLIAVTCLTPAGLALVEFGFSPPDEPTPAAPWWPKGLVNVVNSDGRVLCVETVGFGTESDEFMYRGGAAQFNRFLLDYSEVNAAKLRLMIHAGGPPYNLIYADKLDEPFDWQLGISRRLIRHKGDGPPEGPRDFRLAVHVWPSERIPLRDIVAPLNVEVISGREIERFIKTHKRNQEQAKDDKEEPGA